ncbi:hypothetical protein F4778DRAFT_788247 [Xylariomycetidae sp. FL2044]|nr:hypothetical protein F4778DRAFT_788247 [Xylariomycetidae sp. FL2044]
MSSAQLPPLPPELWLMVAKLLMNCHWRYLAADRTAIRTASILSRTNKRVYGLITPLLYRNFTTTSRVFSDRHYAKQLAPFFRTVARNTHLATYVKELDLRDGTIPWGRRHFRDGAIPWVGRHIRNTSDYRDLASEVAMNLAIEIPLINFRNPTKAIPRILELLLCLLPNLKHLTLTTSHVEGFRNCLRQWVGKSPTNRLQALKLLDIDGGHGWAGLEMASSSTLFDFLIEVSPDLEQLALPYCSEIPSPMALSKLKGVHIVDAGLTSVHLRNLMVSCSSLETLRYELTPHTELLPANILNGIKPIKNTLRSFMLYIIGDPFLVDLETESSRILAIDKVFPTILKPLRKLALEVERGLHPRLKEVGVCPANQRYNGWHMNYDFGDSATSSLDSSLKEINELERCFKEAGVKFTFEKYRIY